MKNFIFIFLIALGVISCKKENTNTATESCPAITPCVKAAIDSSMSQSLGTYYVEIAAYRYKGNLVYLYVEGCCDRLNGLRDDKCKFLFSPSGGVAGCGDCRHPDFFNEAKKICTVWKDPRI
jgi:hypothetical protein